MDESGYAPRSSKEKTLIICGFQRLFRSWIQRHWNADAAEKAG